MLYPPGRRYSTTVSLQVTAEPVPVLLTVRVAIAAGPNILSCSSQGLQHRTSAQPLRRSISSESCCARRPHAGSVACALGIGLLVLQLDTKLPLSRQPPVRSVSQVSGHAILCVPGACGRRHRFRWLARSVEAPSEPAVTLSVVRGVSHAA